MVLLTLVNSCCSGHLKSCYYKSSSIDNSFPWAFPCGSAPNVSTCFEGKYYCAKSSYYINGVGNRIVGTCTDKRWQDPPCPFHYVRHALPSDKSRSDGANSDADGVFSFTLNTTNCNVGTFCLNPDDQTISIFPCVCMFGMGKGIHFLATARISAVWSNELRTAALLAAST